MMTPDEVDKLVMRIYRARKRMERARRKDMPQRFRGKAADLYLALVDRLLDYRHAKKAEGIGKNGK